MHTDPIADMLTRIRNGYRARLERVDVPQSKFKLSLAELLKKEGLIEDFRVIAGRLQGVIEIKLRYDEQRAPVVTGIKRVSKPGLRTYTKWDEIPTVRGGLGTVIVSTSRGVMTDRDARKNRLGGEILCTLW